MAAAMRGQGMCDHAEDFKQIRHRLALIEREAANGDKWMRGSDARLCRMEGQLGEISGDIKALITRAPGGMTIRQDASEASSTTSGVNGKTVGFILGAAVGGVVLVVAVMLHQADAVVGLIKAAGGGK